LDRRLLNKNQSQRKQQDDCLSHVISHSLITHSLTHSLTHKRGLIVGTLPSMNSALRRMRVWLLAMAGTCV